MQKSGTLLILLLLLVNRFNAQSTVTDSLLQRVYHAKNDEEKLDAILEVSMRNDINADTFIDLAFQSKPLAEKSGDLEKIGLSSYFIAWAHYLNSNNDSARITIDETLPRLPAHDRQYDDVIYKLRSFKATTYQGEQNNAEALRILYPLLEDMQKSHNNLNTAQTMHLIAIVEGQQKNAMKTIEWERQALPLLEKGKSNDENVRSTVYATMGKAWMQLNQLDSAAYYQDKAIESFRATGDLYNLAITLQRQAKLLTSMNDLAQAEIVLQELSALNDKIHMGDGDMNYWMAFINFHIQSGHYDQAIALIQERLAHAGETTERSATKWGVRLTYYEALAKCFKAKGNDQELSAVLEKILIAKDSLYAINSAETIADLQTQYEVQKKENTIIEQQLELSRKNALFYGALIVSLLISIIVWLHFRNNARRQQLKMQIQLKEDKMKAEQAVKDAEENERKRIAADLHDNLGSYAASIVSNVHHLQQKSEEISVLNELKSNAQSMVSMLSDTIWALKKEKLTLTAISDRVKLLLQRLSRSYPDIQLDVKEDIQIELQLQPSQGYQLFSIIHEAVNNALKHSHGSQIDVIIDSLPGKSAVVRIIDNGEGTLEAWATSETGNGLYNMKQRAGVLGWHIGWQQNKPSGIIVELKSDHSN